MANTILFCEECGHRNEVDLDALKNSSDPVRCAGCGDLLRIVQKDEKNPEVVIKKGGKSDSLF